MVNTKIIVTCDKCNSTDVTSKETYYNHRFRRVQDAGSLGMPYPSLSSVDVKLVCHCNNCGNNFEEELGSKKYGLLPGEIED